MSYLLTLTELDLEQLVHRFFVVQRIHYGEVDDAAKVGEIRGRPVLYALFLFRNWTHIQQVA